ncbi:hypothetical protein GGD55_003271 [Rhizobium giardinii]|uniref:Lytic murein transglycosylase n=1 Tax=Rhizobium giardinii TaxID=56731 RepID=A0A7W8UBX0_9HYPH|nr:hypothetical protein [Rhizobium giardinii]
MFEFAVLTPLCPVGHLPLKGGDWLGTPTASHPSVLHLELSTSANLNGARGNIRIFQSPPSRGRCHAVTEGGAVHSVAA